MILCLSILVCPENHYQESACVEVLESMRQCCLEHHKVSVCCSGIKLDKVYVKEEPTELLH